MKINKTEAAIIILIIIMLLSFSFTFFYFRNVCKIAKENPLKYAAKEYDINSCFCTTNSGDELYFDKTNVRKTKNKWGEE